MASAPRRGRPPASTPEAMENRLISLAFDLAEKQLREGTASPSVLTHYLKLASSREALEKEKLAKENILLSAKTDSIKSSKDVTRLYSEAIQAMKSYSGVSDDDGDYYE